MKKRELKRTRDIILQFLELGEMQKKLHDLLDKAEAIIAKAEKRN